jgi:hypothetical protein
VAKAQNGIGARPQAVNLVGHISITALPQGYREILGVQVRVNLIPLAI